jgi:hypothetical protein
VKRSVDAFGCRVIVRLTGVDCDAFLDRDGLPVGDANSNSSAGSLDELATGDPE